MNSVNTKNFAAESFGDMPDGIQAQIERSLSLTFTRKEHGSFGAYCYLNGGTEIFDRFKSSPDYHPFHGEKQLFADHADTIATSIEDTERLIVVGQGPWESFAAKELELIDRLPNLKRVDFIDLAEDYNTQASGKLKYHFAKAGRNIKVESHIVNYMAPEALKAIEPTTWQTTVISTGSTFTNPVNASFEGVPKADLAKSLEAFRNLAGPLNKVVLGYDSNSSKARLDAAYSDEQLERFYLNGLKHALALSSGIKGISPEEVDDIFELTRKWHPKISHYAHKIRVRDDADERHISISNEWAEIENLPLSPGDEFTVMSCIKPDPRLISSLAESQGMKTRSKISGEDDNIVHVLKNQNYEAPQPKAA